MPERLGPTSPASYNDLTFSIHTTASGQTCLVVLHGDRPIEAMPIDKGACYAL